MFYGWLVLFGLGVGMFSGLLGIGGGVILVPGLMFLFGLTQTAAQGTSLAVLSLPILIFASWEYYRQGQVQLPMAGMLAAGFCVGALVGARLVPQIPIHWLRIAFAFLLLYLGWTMLISPPEAQPPAAGDSVKTLVGSQGLLAALIALGHGLVLLGVQRWRVRPPQAR